MTRSSSTHRVLVLGGGYAGVLAASRIAREKRANVTLVDQRPAMVQRIRFHEHLAGRPHATLDYSATLLPRGVKLLQGMAEQIRLGEQTVHGSDSEGHAWRAGYDTLVVALGSRTAASVPGVAQHAVRLDDPLLVHRASVRLAALPAGATVVIVGAGATGIETASELAAAYPHLAIVLMTSSNFGTAFAANARVHLRATLERLGVMLVEGETVAAVVRGGVALRSGGTLTCDLCVWAGGFEAVPLARDAGLPVLPDGRVVVDDALRAVGYPEVFVAGDAAAFPHGRAVLRMGCATAMPLGTHAGDNVRRLLSGQQLEPFRYAFMLRCISLGRRNGLVQFTKWDDTPLERHLAGRAGAVTKELISRSTMWVARIEARFGYPVMYWPKSPRQSTGRGNAHRNDAVA